MFCAIVHGFGWDGWVGWLVGWLVSFTTETQHTPCTIVGSQLAPLTKLRNYNLS